MDRARNYLVTDVELNYVRVVSPTENPFSKQMQYEMQIATTDAAKAQELRDNHFNVKEKDGKFVVSLTRKTTKADGSDNGKVRIVDAQKQPMSEDVARTVGNGSRGNVIVFQYPWENMGRKGIGNSLTAVQVTNLEVYNGGGDSVDFDVVGEPAVANAAPEDIF